MPRQLSPLARGGRLALASAALLTVSACGAGEPGPAPAAEAAAQAPATDTPTGPATLQVAAPGLVDGRFDPRHTCDGDQVRPELAWSGLPEGTGAVALALDDLTYGNFLHTVVVDLPADSTGLAEGAGLPAGALQRSALDAGDAYLGPCPTADHEYRFRVFALPAPLQPEPDALPAILLDRLEDEAIAVGEVTVRYQRQQG